MTMDRHSIAWLKYWQRSGCPSSPALAIILVSFLKSGSSFTPLARIKVQQLQNGQGFFINCAALVILADSAGAVD